MKGFSRILSLVLVLSMLVGMFAMAASAKTASTAEVYDIRVDDLVAPVGLDNNPTFSWKMKSDAIGAAQTAYNVIVAKGDETVWDSTWVNDSKSVAVEYAGPALAPSTEYTVKVAIKDETGAQTDYAVSTFETGLLSDTPFADASWITAVPGFKSISKATTYNVEFDVTVITGAANFVFGVQDPSNMFMWQFSASESNFRVRPHTKTGGSWSSANVDVTSVVGNSAAVLGKPLRVRLEVVGTSVKTYIALKGSELTLVDTRTLAREVPMNVVGFRGSTTETASFDNVVITDAKGGIVYAEDFTNTPHLAEVIVSNGSYKVADGQFVVGNSSTSFSENVTALIGRQISDATSYTIDVDFILHNKNADICFGVQDFNNFMMWQINAESSPVRLRPHSRINGAWNTGFGGVKLTGELANLSFYQEEPAHLRIVVDGTSAVSYLGRNADSLTKVLTCTMPIEVPLQNLGIRASASNSGANCEDFSIDNLVVTDPSGNVIYSEDFTEMPLISDLSADSAAVVTCADGKLRSTTTTGSVGYVGMLYTDPEAPSSGLPAYRKTVTPKADLVSAKLYTSGLGVYESYINGQRVGRLMDDGSVAYDELKPGFTEMGVRKFYNSYDVTWLMKAGEENVLSAIVSSGWWSGPVARSFGKETAYLAKLILTYADGTTETVVTDTTWKTANAANVQSGTGIFEGERYDARLSTDWMLPGFDDSDWGGVKVNTEFKGEITAWSGVPITVREELELSPKELYVFQGVTGNTSSAYGTVNVLRTYNDGDAIVLNPGETLLVDLGQNFAGWEYFELDAEAGTNIHVRHGEMLNDGNGAHNRGNDGPEGSIYNENYRSATADTYYIASGAENESYHPSHTFYGFRYAEFTTDKTVTFTKIRGQVVTSSQEDTGVLVTSDKDVNQLVSNARWGMYSNYLSVPTDCPQRDERQGWTADTQNFSEAGCYLGLSKTFLEKFMEDMRDSQRSDGAYPGIAPTGSYSGASWGALGWADAGVIVPYFLYVMYGDTSVITENWESMKKFMDVYMAGTNGMGGSHAYGDWLAYESNDTEIKNMLAVSYYAWDALLMSKMATAIGLESEAQRYMEVYEAEKALFQSLYVKEDGTLIRGEQSVNLYALFLDLLPNEESVQAVTDVLISNIERNGNKLQTGFLGTEIIMHTLTKVGRSDVAYKLLLQHDNPSWLYSVDQGATTIWERWNSYTLASGFGPVGMNSFNHYSYGSVASWMFRGMAGIGWDEAKPGFKHIVLAPQPNQLMPSVEATYESAYGPIVSNMNYVDDQWNYTCTIPANTTATLYLPVENMDTLTGADAKGLTFQGYEDGIATFEVVAGTYAFSSTVAKEYTVTVNSACDNADGMADVVLYVNGEKAANGIPATLTVKTGDVITAEAKALNTVDYKAVNWVSGDEVISDTAALNYTVTGEAELTVNIEWDGMVNLAEGKAVIGSQVNGDWATKNLTDGHLTYHGSNGYSSPSTGKNTSFAEAFVTIDMGAETAFDRIHLYPRNLAPSNVNFPVDYTIYTSNDNASWTPIMVVTNGEVTNGYTPSVIELDTPANARYIRLGVTRVNSGDENKNVYIQLSEMGVYNTGISADETTKIVAESALAALNNYRAASLYTDSAAAEAAIVKAEAAVDAYVQAGGSAESLTNYAAIDVAKTALAQWKELQTDVYTIDFDVTIQSAAQGFTFGATNLDNIYVWQINAWPGTSGEGVLLRPHFMANNAWVAHPGMGNVPAVDISETMGYGSADVLGKTLHERIEVNGNVVKTWFGADADSLKLAHTFEYTASIPVRNVGFRHNSDATGGNEIAIYDNIVIRNGEGDVIFREDFSNPDTVVITAKHDNTPLSCTVANGVLQVSAEGETGTSRFLLGQIGFVKEEAPEVNPDQEAADAVIAKIAAIGEVTLDSKAAIDEARAAYDNAADAAKALVTNVDVLEAAEARYAELVAAAEQEAADKAAAAAVDALIAAIGEVTVNSKAAIDEARAAYTALTEAQQAYVTGLATLEAAEAAYAELTKPEEKVKLILTGEATTNVTEEEVVYTVSAENMNKLATLDLAFSIPGDVLVDPVAEGIGDWYVIAQVYKNNKLTVILGNNKGADGNGDLMTVTAGFAGVAGEATVSISKAILSAHVDEGEDFVEVDLTAASVTTEVLVNKFDVNKDGIVDQLDMTRAQRYFGTDFADADVDESGEVDITDLILILNHYTNENFV